MRNHVKRKTCRQSWRAGGCLLPGQIFCEKSCFCLPQACAVCVWVWGGLCVSVKSSADREGRLGKPFRALCPFLAVPLLYFSCARASCLAPCVLHAKGSQPHRQQGSRKQVRRASNVLLALHSGGWGNLPLFQDQHDQASEPRCCCVQAKPVCMCV